MTFCAHCDALETMHEFRADGSRGKRLGSALRADGTSCCGVTCTGYQPGRVEDRPPEEELRRRLAAVLALDVPDLDARHRDFKPNERSSWLIGYAQALDDARRAARGET